MLYNNNSVYRLRTCIHVYKSIYLQDKPNRSLNSPVKTHELQVLSNDLAEAKDRITQLEFQLDQALEEITEHKQNREIQVGSVTKNMSAIGRVATAANLDVHFSGQGKHRGFAKSAQWPPNYH